MGNESEERDAYDGAEGEALAGVERGEAAAADLLQQGLGDGATVVA